jgi:hypothetical protein
MTKDCRDTQECQPRANAPNSFDATSPVNPLNLHESEQRAIDGRRNYKNVILRLRPRRVRNSRWFDPEYVTFSPRFDSL